MSADTMRSKFVRILKLNSEGSDVHRLDSGQLLLIALLLERHDPITAMSFLELAADRMLTHGR